MKGVSFRIEPGECLGIIGLSGSGKSTLGRMIVGLNAPTEGTVRLGDADVSELCRSQGRQLGYLPQETDLVGGTIREIIARLQDANLDQVIEAAELAGLHETIMRLPAAYDTDVANGGLILLRGHRQRLGLARALFGKPRLVVLDEYDIEGADDGAYGLVPGLDGKGVIVVGLVMCDTHQHLRLTRSQQPGVVGRNG